MLIGDLIARRLLKRKNGNSAREGEKTRIVRNHLVLKGGERKSKNRRVQ